MTLQRVWKTRGLPRAPFGAPCVPLEIVPSLARPFRITIDRVPASSLLHGAAARSAFDAHRAGGHSPARQRVVRPVHVAARDGWQPDAPERHGAGGAPR